MANRTLVRPGIISDALFTKKMETHLGMYLYWMWAPPFRGTSLEAAGADKDLNRPGVYSGGWVASMCLDTLIQSETRGAKSIDDLFRLLASRFGSSGKAILPEDLAVGASEVAGTDLAAFFSAHIASREVLPIKQCLAGAGFEVATEDYAGEAFVVRRSMPSEAERGVMRHLLSGP